MGNEVVPNGTTHMIPANELDYNPQPTYMKWGFDFRGPESGKEYYCWYWWDISRKSWVKDPSFSNRRNVLVEVPQKPLVFPPLYP